MKRPGAIYAIRVRRRRGRTLGYIGKTRQWPEARFRQHQQSQPWRREIREFRVVKRWAAIGGVALWWAEVWRIVLMLPLYNIQWNWLNPFRVKPWRMRR